MTDIMTEDQLRKTMEAAAEEALKGITGEVIEIFKEYIEDYVYASHKENSIYHAGSGDPTYEFLNAWDWTDIKKQINILSTEMWFNPGKLTSDIDTFKHGSKYSYPTDVRASMMDILNKQGYSSSLWLSVYRPIAYWDKFIEDFFNRGDLEKIVTKHFLAKGFTKI